MGEYLGAGRIGKDIVRFLLLGNLSELVVPDRIGFGGGGRIEELVDIPFSRYLVSLYHGLIGGSCGLLPLLYPLSAYFSCPDFFSYLGLHLG
ncbi:hypothetical protein N658DRAFT_227957 [Parathielavia hyrcaniae]|uniref:Uncharacterized protein n=1 Tax=Parathielavia hyrcaniae TaxID=113614 RepID=A0AAN6SZ06_9PEZI|nr:hypothetical protein N658DRAFT_227957 [Parathielavia hyrcaniae]